MKFIVPFLKPNLVKKEDYLKYLAEMDSSRIYSNFGPLNERFEARILEEYFCGQGAVTTVTNATIGLMLAIAQAKNPSGRYALMPSFTFAATPLAALWCGLEPYFIDIRPGDWCLNESLVKEKIKELGTEIGVVVPYAAFGTDFDLEYFRNLHRSGIPVVIDAAPSFGTSTLKGQFGKEFPGFVVFSFHATKSFGIGEGGLVYSGDSGAIERLKQAANFGFSSHRESQVFGLNGKLSEFHAAIGLATLDKFLEKKKCRMAIKDCYLKYFENFGLFKKGWTFQCSQGDIAYQFMPVLCPEYESSLEISKKLEDKKIQIRTYFAPACHRQKQFSQFDRTDLSITDSVASRILSLPLWEEMDVEDVKNVVKGLLR